MAVNILSIHLLDDAGKASTTVVHLPSGFTVPQYEAFAVTYAEALDAVTGAKITGASIELDLDLAAATLKANAIADHLNQFGANFGFDVAGSNLRHPIFVPAIDQGLVVAGALNMASALITTWAALITAGDLTIEPTNAHEQDIVSLIGGKVSFRKRGR